MHWVDLHNVEYGECIALGTGPRSMLMVDCGSLNTTIREGERNFKDFATHSLTARYSGVPHRAFLLTHYHRDHSCGLWDILDARPDYFEELYLPCSPCDERGLPLLLEFALFAYVFLPRQGFCGQVSTGALKAFSRVLRQTRQGTAYAIGQGDTFASGDVTYECLWPPRQDFPFDDRFVDAVERLHLCVESPYQPGAYLLRQFLDLLYEFCNLYVEFCTKFPVSSADASRTLAVLNRIDDLAPSLWHLPAAVDVRAILENQSVREAYSNQVNAASIVFQNCRDTEDATDDILMTGDATPETIAAVEPSLYHDYYILKAPHHGTASAVSLVLTGLSAAHVLISCGEDPGGTRQIAADWAAMPAMKHCTGGSCAFLEESGCCCTRTAVCWDSGGGGLAGGLALRCPGNRSGEIPCGIRVVGTAEYGCICDTGAQE